MSLSSPFIVRPVGTTLLTLAIALAGILAYFMLPVAPLPAVDLPTINVNARLPGASPETMASAVATPLERQFGRIAGITEMTSNSELGSTNITLQFDLSRDINAAARDVQAAINAAGGTLPTNLPNQPTYRKVNPSDSPILILAVNSDLYDSSKTYDAASTILAQKISQIDGVGRVDIWGSSLPAVRVEVNPTALTALGLGLSDVRTALQNANALRPKGTISGERYSWSISSTDQLLTAAEYRPLIVAYRNGSAVRLSDVANVIDSIQDTRVLGLSNNKPSTSMAIFRQPNANIIATTDAILELLPQLQASIPKAMNLQVIVDRTTTIRASVEDTQFTLCISVLLVICVVFFFLRDWRSTFIPSVAVPVSLIGTFGVMYLCGYSLDNLSLMALTIATGFVVDDAIVVVENISRHREAGMSPMKAALKGASEIGFTVLSISVSLVAVFIPILLMGGYIGRLFREFAVTLSVAIGVSLIISLTTTPMLCAVLLTHNKHRRKGWLNRSTERLLDWNAAFYRWTLGGVLKMPSITLAVTLAVIALTVYLYTIVPTGLFPQQDTGRMRAWIQADQDTSSQAMKPLLRKYAEIVAKDPAVANFTAFTGGGQTNGAGMFIALKPLDERKMSVDEVIDRLRKSTAHIPGAQVFFNPLQDLRIGGRSSNAQFQYTLQADNLADLLEWAPKVTDKLKTVPGLLDVNSDQQTGGLEARLDYDRATAKRLGLDPVTIDAALYDAFGQRQVSTMYRSLNQYRVVMETPPAFAADPTALSGVYVRPSNGGAPVPLSAVASYGSGNAPLSVNHQGLFPCITISFALDPAISLSEATDRVENAAVEIGMPATIVGRFAGTAKAFQDSQSTQPLLIAAAIISVYIVLGVLYESLIHPITILSTLPSAGLGALLALLMFGMELDLIATIGIILLVGIVKKNAIMMIDFALSLERTRKMTPRAAIFEACQLRFRPIMMTTMAALLGGLPLALGTGVGSELRRPLGVAIVGGLIVSQTLTLYTTPVIYLYLDRLRIWARSLRQTPHRSAPGGGPMMRRTLLLAAIALPLASCKVGPDYKRPAMPVPTTYRSVSTQPATQPVAQDWWLLFGDPTLTELEEKAIAGNYNLQAAMARVEQARATAGIARSGFFPVASLGPSLTRSARGPNSGAVVTGGTITPGGTSTGGNSGTRYANSVSIPLDLSYEFDLWGRVRRQFEAAQARTMASIADFGFIRLTLTTDIATNYFNLRALDAQDEIAARNIAIYKRQLDFLTEQQKAGFAAPLDVIQVRTLMESTEATRFDLQRQRRLSEHAIAILLGIPPNELNLPTRPLTPSLPDIPAGIPADLLRQRPDVAQAESTLVATNAQVGEAISEFLPTLSLGASAGWRSSSVQGATDFANRFFSIGPVASIPLFDASLGPNLKLAQAQYVEQLATYRNTLLSAFRDVEDALTNIDLQARQAEAQERAVKSAHEYVRLAEIQQRQGIITPLQVLDADRTLLENELTAAQILNSRMASIVLLIRAIGGGWSPDLPPAFTPTTQPAEQRLVEP